VNWHVFRNVSDMFAIWALLDVLIQNGLVNGFLI
jgi:hypothetical protein